MSDREKLIEILSVPIYPHLDADPAEVVADYLIDNGVTVQKWIPVSERLPAYNVDVLVYRPTMALKVFISSYEGYYGEDDNEWYEGWSRYGKDMAGTSVVTHWLPLPELPKECE